MATFPLHAPTDSAALYLDLLKRMLLNWHFLDFEASLTKIPDQERKRLAGQDWPVLGHTMIGLARLNHLQDSVEQLLKDNVPGDFLEAGVWRGGACILMRAILQVRNIKNRQVWLADSFAGLPPPDTVRYPQDTGLDLHRFPQLAVSLERVKYAFSRYGLLDDQVAFLPGWFKDTLPTAPVGQLALLRLDGDLYESTIDTLKHLYPKVSPAGLVIVDDYLTIPACRQAVDDYRRQHQINEPITTIDPVSVCWHKRA